jgi:Domain of unknown function (DUF6379)
MLEAHVIQTKGFKNVDGGFQVAVRCPYYRGIWASLVEGVELIVDGESFAAHSVRWTLGGRSYATAELAGDTEARWPFEEPAILTVDRPGGLEPGLHEVEVAITWRWSYIPIEMQPTTNISNRKLVLVR